MKIILALCILLFTSSVFAVDLIHTYNIKDQVIIDVYKDIKLDDGYYDGRDEAHKVPPPRHVSSNINFRYNGQIVILPVNGQTIRIQILD